MPRKKYYDRYKSKEVCTSCGREALPGKTRCETCRAMQRLADQRYKDKMKKQGRCPMCGIKLDPVADKGFIDCVNCRIGLHVPRDLKHLIEGGLTREINQGSYTG